MEFGDIIYFILLVFFVILGFFNDSRKKKQQQKQLEAMPPQPEADYDPYYDFDEEPEPQIIVPQPVAGRSKTTMPPPMPGDYSAKERYDNFQSSLDLVSIHEEPSTLSSYTFDYDANSFYDKDPDSPDIADTYHGSNTDKMAKGPVHPLIKELRGEASREELKKGLVYGEIIQRKY